MTEPRPARPASPVCLLLALFGAALAVPLSVLFFDRPIASWSHATLHGIVAFDWLTHLVDPIVPAAVIVLAASGIAALFGWRPGRWARVLIACAVATLVAVSVKEYLKFAFGRTWPETWVNNNPSWIGDGTYGFQPFHGGQGWASFPSGHMTLISAPMAVLWREFTRLRALWASLAVLVAIGLLGADYHFFGDVIAGTYLGAACGLGVAALVVRQPPDAAP
jgi:membrane-associated phospholipid phosphatase